MILVRKMLRDIRKNKVQFAAVFLMMFFGCFLYSGITGEWGGLKKHFEDYIRSQNLADVWAYDTAFTKEELEKLEQDTRVTEAEGRMAVPMGIQGQEDASLDCIFAKDNRISKLYIREGIPFDSSKKGIWLDASFAEENNLKVGDRLTLTYQGLEITGEIVGLADSPEYIYGVRDGSMMPEHRLYGFAWISPRLLPSEELYSVNQAAVKTKEKQSTILLREILENPDLTVLEAEKHPTVSMVQDEIKQHKTIGSAFSSAFLMIAVMIVMTTMHRMLRNQRTQIGILKAFGFSRLKLLIHYLSHSGTICFCGALAGCVLGCRVMPGIIYPFMKEIYVLPEWGGYLPPVYLLLPVICVLFCITVSLVICRKYLKGNASECLYREESGRRTVSLPEICRPLPFSSRWNLRDVERNRLRSFMTLCGILGCTALLFCAFALFDTFQNLSEWTFTKQQGYECKITNLPDTEGQRVLLSRTEGEYLMETSAVIKDGKKEKEVSLTVPESTKYIKLAGSLDDFVGIGDGIALSKKIADSMGLKTGDTVTWKQAGEKEWRDSKVEAVIRTPLSQGITIMKSSFEKEQGVFVPTGIIGKEPARGFAGYEKESSITHQSDLTKGIDAMMEGMIMMIALLVLGAVILGGVMLYNLGVLSYLERGREFATMKVLGFADMKIRSVMVEQNVWLSAAGILLGLPAGYGLLIYMLSTIPESMDVPIFIKGMSWIFSAAGTLALSWLISLAVSRKIPHINMVEALKAKE